MNRGQLGLLSLGLAALVGILVFPPWVAITTWADGSVERERCGWHLLLAPPRAPAVVPELRERAEAKVRAGKLYRGPDAYMVDTMRLIVPISIVCAITLSGLVWLRHNALGRVSTQ